MYYTAPDVHLELVTMVAFTLHSSYHKRQASQTTTHRKSLHLGACARVRKVQGSVAGKWEESGREAGSVPLNAAAGNCRQLPAHGAQSGTEAAPGFQLGLMNVAGIQKKLDCGRRYQS